MNEKKIKRNFFELTVKAVIVNDKGEIILAKRSDNDSAGKGKYDLPGGKLEFGENIKDGLKREIKEEMGIDVEIGPVMYVFDFGKKYDKKIEIGEEHLLVSGKGLRFLVYYKSGEIKLSKEHQQFEWISIEKALEKFGDDEYEDDKKVAIKKAREYLELKTCLDGWQRCQADFENYKKRQGEERKDILAFSNLNFILEILPVLDNFHASTDHIPPDQKDNAWVTGIMHIQKQLEKILEDSGVTEVPVKIGDEFNPEAMEALENKESKPEECKNMVKKIVIKGYQMNGKIIRAAKVIVE